MIILKLIILLMYLYILIFIKHSIFFIATSFLKHLFFYTFAFFNAVNN